MARLSSRPRQQMFVGCGLAGLAIAAGIVVAAWMAFLADGSPITTGTHGPGVR